MRVLCLAAALTVLSSTAMLSSAAPAANKTSAGQTWIGVCYGEDTQYTQTVGGAGYFHVGIGNHRYDTQKLKQSYYDGTVVCAVPDPKAPRAESNVAEVCADRTKKTISVLYRNGTQTKTAVPHNAQLYCKARINVL